MMLKTHKLHGVFFIIFSLEMLLFLVFLIDHKQKGRRMPQVMLLSKLSCLNLSQEYFQLSVKTYIRLGRLRFRFLVEVSPKRFGKLTLKEDVLNVFQKISAVTAREIKINTLMS